MPVHGERLAKIRGKAKSMNLSESMAEFDESKVKRDKGKFATKPGAKGEDKKAEKKPRKKQEPTAKKAPVPKESFDKAIKAGDSEGALAAVDAVEAKIDDLPLDRDSKNGMRFAAEQTKLALAAGNNKRAQTFMSGMQAVQDSIDVGQRVASATEAKGKKGLAKKMMKEAVATASGHLEELDLSIEKATGLTQTRNVFTEISDSLGDMADSVSRFFGTDSSKFKKEVGKMNQSVVGLADLFLAAVGGTKDAAKEAKVQIDKRGGIGKMAKDALKGVNDFFEQFDGKFDDLLK